MKQFNGTPGPWVRHEPSGYQHSMGGYILGREGKICEVSGFDVGSDAAKENAKLIAAAPELLKALQLIIKDLRIRARIRGDVDDDGTVVLDIGSGVLIKANDAIAKALGQ